MNEPKVILVTGSSRGIGQLTAKSLARAGHVVFAGTRDADSKEVLAAWAWDRGVQLEPVQMDVTDEASVEAAVRSVTNRMHIDVLINNAGIMPVGVTEACTPAQFQHCLEINLLGAVRTCRAVLPQMRERKSGLIIHLGSTAGRLAIPFFGVYSASKWALEAYAEALHYELEEFGVESIIVEPGGYATDRMEEPPAPADRGRIDGYRFAAGGSARMLQSFGTMFALGDSVTDAQKVAEAVVELVDRTGPRPIRTPVGNDRVGAPQSGCDARAMRRRFPEGRPTTLQYPRNWPV